MKFERLFRCGAVIYQTKFDAPEIREMRISPQSYRRGEEAGFLCGATVGFVLGVLVAIFVAIAALERMY